MQINNFYTDMMPSVRSPLDSIALSPHTISHSDFKLANMQKDTCDYQSVLMSTGSCKYYDSTDAESPSACSRWLRNRCDKLLKQCRIRHQ